MPHVWLRTNRRYYAWGLLLPCLMVGVGLALALGWLGTTVAWVIAFGWVLAAIGGLGMVSLVWELLKPRLAVDDDFLWVYAARSPVAVPLDIVECFLLGQGPAHLPGQRFRMAESTNLIIRLAEKAEDWQRRDVDHKLANWCGGYITLRGTWCEPLTVELVQRLNRYLTQAHRAQQERRHALRETPPPGETSAAAISRRCAADSQAGEGMR